MTWYITDYGLTAKQLQTKHERLGYHPGYTKETWREMGSREKYWSWVKGMLISEEDELQRNHPYI